MCCFSKPVSSVKATEIFARAGDDREQFLVYSMTFRAKEALAMILPLPVNPGSGEKAVHFIDLKGYPNFFADLRSGFPVPTDNLASPPPASLRESRAQKLEVVHVGDFEASFVPTVKDFSRLDARFRLPTDTWTKLPGYTAYGFAVFKLKPGAMTVHPMAFSFPRREPQSLFFPTVHIHDGKVHPRARFDHTLFCQPHADEHPDFGGHWDESTGHANSFMRVDAAKGVIDAHQHCYKRELHGQLANRDTILKTG